MKRDHQRLRQRDHMRRVGTDDIAGRLPSGLSSLAPRPPAATKAEQRARTEAAWREWSATRGSS
jgi:hypothetical protein